MTISLKELNPTTAQIGAYFEETENITYSENAILRLRMEPVTLAKRFARDAMKAGVKIFACEDKLISIDETGDSWINNFIGNYFIGNFLN